MAFVISSLIFSICPSTISLGKLLPYVGLALLQAFQDLILIPLCFLVQSYRPIESNHQLRTVIHRELINSLNSSERLTNLCNVKKFQLTINVS